MVTTLAVSAATGLVVAALYAFVGYRLQGRKVSDAARIANYQFTAWWYALAASSAVGAFSLALHAAGRLPSWFYQVTTQFSLLAITVALWGLLSYLVYLYTGSRRVHLWIGGFYVVFYVLLQAAVAYFGPPDQISDNGWNLEGLYEQDGELAPLELSRAWGVAVLLVLLGPQLAGAFAYAMLYRKATDNTQRYRIAMVSGSILVWFGTSALAGLAGAGGLSWQVASRVLSIAAAVAILLAYHPPGPLRRRWGLRSIGEVDAVT